jgi:hypothetical protein
VIFGSKINRIWQPWLQGANDDPFFGAQNFNFENRDADLPCHLLHSPKSSQRGVAQFPTFFCARQEPEITDDAAAFEETAPNESHGRRFIIIFY